MSITEESTKRVYKCLFCYFNLSEVFRIKKKMREINGRAQGAFWGVCHDLLPNLSERQGLSSLQCLTQAMGPVPCTPRCLSIRMRKNCAGVIDGQAPAGPDARFPRLRSLSSRILPGNQTLALASHLFCTSDSEFHVQNVMGSCREEEQSDEQAQGARLAKGLILVVLVAWSSCWTGLKAFFF